MVMRIGLQLYTVRDSFKNNPMRTLEHISKLGYKVIETANYNALQYDIGAGFRIPAVELKKKADEVGVKIISGHISPGNSNAHGEFYEREDNINKIIDYFSILECKHFTIPVDFFPTKEHLLRRCEIYNKIGEMFYKSGMRFLYHNHYHEFQRFNGEYIFDLIMANTDQKYMGIEFDTFWAIHGGANPIDKIHQYKGRIEIIHQKDFPMSRIQNINAWAFMEQDVPLDWDGFHNHIQPEYFIELGEGIIKIQDIIDKSNEFNIPYLLVEQDYTLLNEMESIEKSINYLKKLRGVVWD